MVVKACLLDGGRGYASTERPAVVVSAPDGGAENGTAIVRAELETTGQVRPCLLPLMTPPNDLSSP